MKSNLRVHCFRYIANLILVVAFCVGLYGRWVQTKLTFVIVIASLSAAAFALSAALVCYYDLPKFGYSLSRLWVGGLLGVLAFSYPEQPTYSSIEDLANTLLVTSVVVRCFWIVLERALHVMPRTANMDGLEVVGMCASCVMCGPHFVAVGLLVAALALTVQAIRLKSFLALLNLVGLCVLAAWQFFPKSVQMNVNPFPLVCFLVRLAFEPVIDLYFCSSTMLERWMPIFTLSSIVRRLAILGIVVLELTFFSFSARQVPSHKEWYIVVPIFAVVSVVWWSYHLVFVITVWQLNNKITECTPTDSESEENSSLRVVLAARGIRHFSLIAQRLALVTFLSSLVLTLVGWITKTALSLSLFLLVVPVEVCIMSLLFEMGRQLGGTCIGYALVAPITPQKREQQSPKVLPINAVQEMSLRATTTLNTVQEFFAHHLVDVFGCDYTSSGLSQTSVETKLRSLFQRTTADGPRYDTYIIYYSGHVYDNGDWATTEDGSLKLETVLALWREYQGPSSAGMTGQDTGARLLLILDTMASYHWAADLRRHSDVVVAVQTCRAVRTRDLEEAGAARVGAFTRDWVRYNCGGIGGGGGGGSAAGADFVDWQSKERTLRAVYNVTGALADFRFRLPTREDIAHHWNANFPRMTRPLIAITNIHQCGHWLNCPSSDWLARVFRRLRLRWLPPRELDTGHGFKLIRS